VDRNVILKFNPNCACDLKGRVYIRKDARSEAHTGGGGGGVSDVQTSYQCLHAHLISCRVKIS